MSVRRPSCRVASLPEALVCLFRPGAAALALIAGGGLSAPGAHASSGHEPARASAEAHVSQAEELKLPAKPDLKRKEALATKGKAETAPEPVAEGKSSVSMAELRELIDQKIAEVRAKQAAAPAVKVVSRAPRARKPVAAAASAPEAHLLALASTAPHGGPHGIEGRDLHWEYSGATGPQNWAQLKPEFQTCAIGKRQSPIDIRDGIKVQLEPIQFDYRPTPFRVIDNGHTVQVNVEPGNTITVNSRRYELVQFHFHRPSEERINGRQYDLVAHLVHKDAEGRLAVVAVLMDQGKEHPMVQLVWNSLPLEKGMEQASPVMLDMGLMLPEQRQYYTYMGSLTTPPCTEGVLWLVMKQPATLSREQLSIFTRLYANNARPLQAQSGRLIKEGM